MNKTQIDTSFHEYFQPVLANTKEQMEEIFKIRYQVYCKEFQFEREEDCPDQKESDEYDDQSLHCLLIHQPSGQAAGCVRMVLADPKDPQKPLPFEKFCGDSLNREIIDPARLPRSSFGEISRLAVVKGFRRRKNEDKSPIGSADIKLDTADSYVTLIEQRHFPFIALGLYLAAASTGMLSGLEGVFAMMEPRLARLLSRYGIKFIQAGKIIDYHGPRAPFYISRHDLLNGLKPELNTLMDVISNDLVKDIKRAPLEIVK